MDTYFPTFRRMTSGVSVPLLRPWYTSAAQQRGLLRMIATAIEERLPLAPLLAAWTEDERGPQKHRLHRLVRLLNNGTPLLDALEQVPGLLREEDVLALRFDAQSGTSTAAVRDTLDEPYPAQIAARRPRHTLFYLCIVLLFAIPVVAFVQIKIVPELNKIYEEFAIEPPRTLVWSVGITNVIVQFWWLIGLGLLLLLWSAFSQKPGRFVRRNVLDRMLKPRRELHTASLLRHLRIGLNAGRPIASALSTLARYHFDPSVRKNLLFVRNEVEQGTDAWHSLGAVDMLTPAEVRVLVSAECVGNRPWVLEQLAIAKSRRAFNRLDRMADLMLPIFVLFMGAFVLLQGLSMFSVLSRLVESLA